MNKTYVIDGWTMEVYETNGCGIAVNITSPVNRTASCLWLGFDNRLTKYRTQANIQFSSCTLKLTETMVDRLIEVVGRFSSEQAAIEPEASLTNV